MLLLNNKLDNKEYPTEAGLYYILHRMTQQIYIGVSNNLSLAFLDNDDKLFAGIHENQELQGYHDNHPEHLVFMYIETPSVNDAVEFLKKILSSEEKIVSLMNDENQFKKFVTGCENPLHPKVEYVKSLKYFTESMMYENEEQFAAINACLGLKFFFEGITYPNVDEANKAIKSNISDIDERENFDVRDVVGSEHAYWLDMHGKPLRYTLDRDFFKQ